MRVSRCIAEVINKIIFCHTYIHVCMCVYTCEYDSEPYVCVCLSSSKKNFNKVVIYVHVFMHQCDWDILAK